MAVEYASIEIKRRGDKLVVMGTGRTGRGTKYIKASEPLNVKSPADPKFKAELATAVAKLFAETPAPE